MDEIFFAIFGVCKGLADHDQLITQLTLQVPLFGMSLVAIVILALAGDFLIRRKTV